MFRSIQETLDFVISNEHQEELTVCVSSPPSRAVAQSHKLAFVADDDKIGRGSGGLL
jgi:hypothetical protein